MLEGNRHSSFLSELYAKRANILKIGDITGKNIFGALQEVDRQIHQAMPCAIKGEGVTKSAEESLF